MQGGVDAMPITRHRWTDPRWIGLAVAITAVGSTGCQAFSSFKNKAYSTIRSTLTSSYHDPDAESKVTRAEQQLAAGDYRAAQTVFADVADNTYNPVLLAEKARYLEAECLRERRHFTKAVATYNRLLMDFPAGAYRERASSRMYEIAYHEWLEKDTLADIEAEMAGTTKPWWQRTELPNPFDETRPTFDAEGEALKALENAHTHDLTGPNADKALFWAGYVHFYRGRFEEADHFFSQLVEMHKDSRLRPVALEMAIMAKNNSTGGAVYDSTKAAEALQLVHHAEATEPTYRADDKKSEWLTRQKLAVRMQLAEKDFKTAEYYERTGHPASAYFYYELVCRRYPGTKLSDLAKMRLSALEQVKQRMDDDRANGRYEGTTGMLTRQWDRMLGRPVDPLGVDPTDEDDSAAATPTPPRSPAPPQVLPADIGGTR